MSSLQAIRSTTEELEKGIVVQLNLKSLFCHNLTGLKKKKIENVQNLIRKTLDKR